MASYTTVVDWKDVEDGYVADVTIRQTDAEMYPSGWDYGLHVGKISGDTILRYDNAHERTKGHERHTEDDVEYIEFPGMSHCTTALNGRPKSCRPSRGTGRSRTLLGGKHHANAQSHRRRSRPP